MSNRYDIIFKGQDAPSNFNYEGEKWGYYGFERRGEIEADFKVNTLIAQGYEAKKIYIGKSRKRDIDD